MNKPDGDHKRKLKIKKKKIEKKPKNKESKEKISPDPIIVENCLDESFASYKTAQEDPTSKSSINGYENPSTFSNETLEFLVPALPGEIRNRNFSERSDDTNAICDNNNKNITMDDTLNLIDDFPSEAIEFSPKKLETKSQTFAEASTSSSIEIQMPDMENILLKINLEINMNNKNHEPDAPENVRVQTNVIFSSLIRNELLREGITDNRNSSFSQIQSDCDKTLINDSLLDSIEELPFVEADSVEERAAKCVADLGDQIMNLYENRLCRMIDNIPDDLCPIEMFKKVANQTFKLKTLPNWGQVITLLYFGYLLVRKRLNQGILTAFRQIYDCIQSLFHEANLFLWIAQQGGWRVLSYFNLVETSEAGGQEAGQILPAQDNLISRINDLITFNPILTSSIVVTATISYALFLIFKRVINK